ncbi:MAG: rhamnan synthesis F family protein [Clostridiales bacterium]|nr:rhamnan synthesis F family protein [Clostridiales bacterium]
MKRAVIFSLLDKDGYADGYVLELLRAMKEQADLLVLVCRGALHEGTRAAVEEAVDRVVINKDAEAHNYAKALSEVGEIKGMDEAVFLSSVFFGPVYPLAEMFAEMEAHGDLDFWTLTPHGFSDRYPYPYEPLPDISEQSHMSFVAFRKGLMGSGKFTQFWDILTKPGRESDEASVANGELLDDITGYFAQIGYRGGSYITPSGGDDLNPFHMLHMPKTLFEKYRCPLFDIRAFTTPKHRILENTFGEPAGDFLRALESLGEYDVGLIWEWLIRAAHPCDFVNALGLVHILPTSTQIPEADPIERNGLKVALFMHLYYMDLLGDSLAYAQNVPASMDIFVTTSSEEKARSIEAAFAALPNKVEVRLVENRGRNESAMLVGLADIAKSYDFICYYHDKKTDLIEPASIGRSNAYKLQLCTLPSHVFALNTIDIFLKNPLLGFLTPTEPNHAYYSKTPGNEWASDFENTLRLHGELGLTAPIAEDRYPVASYGSVFWFRCAALKRLFEKGWRYEDFPEEPVSQDESLLHAIERIYPYVCQSEGYIPAYLMSDRAAELEILNLRESLRQVNLFAKKNGVVETLGALLSHFDYQLFRGQKALEKIDGAGDLSAGAFLKAKVKAGFRGKGEK